MPVIIEFSRCIGTYSSAKFELSKFDTSNVLFMENMFVGCGNLTNLDISGFNTSRVATFDMSKGANVTDLFAQCNNLKQIITPKITGIQSVSLPEGVWRGSDGNTYQTIPQNVTNSITLTKE